MSATSELNTVELHPIEEGLTTFRGLFKTICKDLGDLGVSVSSDAVRVVFSTATEEGMTQYLGVTLLLMIKVGKRLLINFVSALKFLPAARILTLRTGGGTFLGNLRILFSRIIFNQYYIESSISLVEQAEEDGADGPICNDMNIGHAVFDFITQPNELAVQTKTPPP